MLLSTSSVVTVVSEVYNLDVSMSLQQSLSFIKELVTADIKDLSAEYNFDSSRSSQQIDNVSENKYIVQQLTLIKDLTLRLINQSLEIDIKDSSSKVDLESIFIKKIILNLIN